MTVIQGNSVHSLLKMITRPAAFLFFLLQLSNIAVAQFCTVPYEKIKSNPFQNMTLYVQATGTAEGDAFLDDLLTKYWTLTPKFHIVPYTDMQEMRENEKALFLEHSKIEMVKVEMHDSSAPPGEAFHSTMIESGLMEADLLEALAPPFFVKPRIGNNFRVYGGHKSFITITRGMPAGLKRSDPGPFKTTEDPICRQKDLIAYAPIAIQSWEAKGAGHTFRQALLLKGSIKAIELVRTGQLEGVCRKLIHRQYEAFNAGLVDYDQRRMMIPKEVFDEKLHNTFKEVFKEKYSPTTLEEVDQQYHKGPIDALLLLPVDGWLIVTDLANDNIVYVDEGKGRTTKADIRRWGLEMYLASKKMKMYQR